MLARSPRFLRLAFSAAAVCATLLLPARAAAGPGARARLRFQRLAGAESCPTQAAFQGEVASWLGYDPFSEAAARAVIVDLTGSATGLEAHLQLQDGAGKALGERQISTASPDCRDLTQALVLAVALAVDPLPITRDVISLNEPPAAPAQPPAVQTSATPVPPVATARSTHSAAQLSISVGGLLSVLAGPEPAPGLIAGLELRWDHFSLGIDGKGDAFTGQPWPPGSVQVSLVAAELVPCYRLGLFGFCALLAAGAELGHGEGIRGASNQPVPYLGAGGRILADLHLSGPLSLRLQVDALGTVLGARFYVGNADVWDTPVLTLETAAILALRL